MSRIAVLISGRGSNLQSIIDAIAERRLDATLAVVISNRAEAAGLNRAKDAGIETINGYYFATPKNGMVAAHYSAMGFSQIAVEDGRSEWALDLTRPYAPRNGHIRRVEYAGNS